MFKNWQAISNVGDVYLMNALALLDLTSDLGQRIVAQLPEFFLTTEIQGPVPLSLLFKLGSKFSLEQYGYSTDCLVSHNRYWGEYNINIPIIAYSTIDDNDLCEDLLPDEIWAQIKELNRRVEVGDVFTHNGKQLVVLENNDSERGDCCLMYFAPKEAITIDK